MEKVKRKKVKLTGKRKEPFSGVEPEVPPTPEQLLLNTTSESLGKLANDCQVLLDEMRTINVNIHPIKVITKIRWEEALSTIIREASTTFHSIAKATNKAA